MGDREKGSWRPVCHLEMETKRGQLYRDLEDREGKIREQEMELRQMLDLSPQQVVVLGPGGERLFANRIALDYVGLSLEEWWQISGNVFRPGWFIHHDDREVACGGYSIRSP